MPADNPFCIAIVQKLALITGRFGSPKEIFDEFVEPASFIDFGGIKKDDGIIFINFRNDRARQICAALASDDFTEFNRQTYCKNLITMTSYDDKFSFPIMFKNDDIKDVINNLTEEMLKHAEKMEFEEAAKLRDKIKELEKLL